MYFLYYFAKLILLIITVFFKLWTNTISKRNTPKPFAPHTQHVYVCTTWYSCYTHFFISLYPWVVLIIHLLFSMIYIVRYIVRYIMLFIMDPFPWDGMEWNGNGIWNGIEYVDGIEIWNGIRKWIWEWNTELKHGMEMNANEMNEHELIWDRDR